MLLLDISGTRDGWRFRLDLARLRKVLLSAWYHLPGAALFLVGVGLVTLPGSAPMFNNPLGFLVALLGAGIAVLGLCLWSDASRALIAREACKAQAEMPETEPEAEIVRR